MEKYENLGLVGEGSYGMVIKCKNKESGRIVAIKKFIDSEDDKHVKKIALREIRMLKQLRHDNLVNLLEVFRRKKRLYLVFEFVDNTILDDLEKHPNGIDEMRTKRTLFQVIRGVEFCHLHNIVHRDIKPENILISRSGVVKLCDFGFARTLAAPGEVYTDYVATRWYRAPELLVGDTKYGRPIDIWAIGCLASEMLTGDPLFPGDSDIDQLHRIVRCLGNLSEKYQNIFHRNPLFVGMRVPFAKEIDPLDKRLAKVSKITLGFIKICLRIDANDRPTSSALLRSEYFTSENFASIFLEELKTLIKSETNSNVPSSSTNITSNKNTVNNLNNNNNQTQVKNDQQCKISNNNSDFVQSKVSNTTTTTTTPILTYITTTTTTTTTTGNTCTDTSTTTTTAVKHFLSDVMNVKNPNKDKTITPDHVDLSVTSQAGLHNNEITEQNKSSNISTDFSSNTKSTQMEGIKLKSTMADEQVNLTYVASKARIAVKSQLYNEYLVHDENIDPHHLLDTMNVSKKQHYGSDNILNRNDDSDSKELLTVTEKMNDRLNEMPSIPQKSFGLLTTVKCKSPKPTNPISKSILEDLREPLNDTDLSSASISISPLQVTNLTINEQSLINTTNQSPFNSGFVAKVTEVPNEQIDCTSTVIESSVNKYLDTKGGDSQPKEMTSNKRLPYLTLGQTSSYHFFPQQYRGVYQNPLKSDQTNTYNPGTVSSGMGLSSLSPLLTNSQIVSKHENNPAFQSTNVLTSPSIPLQTWTTQISSSNTSNSSKDSKSRRYYQPPNHHRKSTFSLQFPMNISHSVCQPISTSLSNHYHNHNHHLSILQPIGIMPSPNIFDTNHDYLHPEQTESRSYIGHVNFSTRSPLQTLSQQNVFKKSFTSNSTTGTSKQDNTYSLTGNQHSFSPQVLPAFTCSSYSTNQYGTNTKPNHNNQFPINRLRNSDKFWLGSLPRR
ncbi:unnamed protein product [Schistosoma curassoni]|nr:unnamed protein product [Schistosoma curassoni]